MEQLAELMIKRFGIEVDKITCSRLFIETDFGVFESQKGMEVGATKI
jgi:hypothetical protein